MNRDTQIQKLREAIAAQTVAYPTISQAEIIYDAVFEVAYTPTDDEREALEVQDLATIIGNVVIDYEDTGPHSSRPITIRETCADWPMEIAGEVQAHGFHRTAGVHHG